MKFAEKWLPVRGYEGIYEVSNWGRVRSVERLVKHSRGGTLKIRARTRKLGKNSHGYLHVTLRKNGAVKTLKVHRLVASQFVLNFVGQLDDEVGFEVNHLDGNKTNNHATNLEYVTAAGNIQHARDVLGNPGGKLSSPDVIEIRRLRAAGLLLREIADAFAVSQSTICHIVNCKTWKDVH